MPTMSDFDHSDLDGRLLHLLLAVVEERSVTRAARRLGVTQSAVSHMLHKLRRIVRDPLVVKAGRGIVPTARAETLATRARLLIEDLRAFAAPQDFDAATLTLGLTIAANDLECNLVLPPLLRRLQAQAPGITLRVIPAGVPQAELLRSEACQLVITPRPPDAADLLQRRLLSDRYAVFYDAQSRAAPRDLEDYLAAGHVTVVYASREGLNVDRLLAQTVPAPRRFVASVPTFAGIPPFLRGSPLLATLPSLLRLGLLRDLALAPLPVATPEMPIYMVWHARQQSHPVHRWLREQVLAVVDALALDAPATLSPAAAGPAG